MEHEVGWDSAIEQVENAFARGEANLLGPLLRDLRRSRLPPIPEAERRLLVVHGLERAERCALSGDMGTAYVEFQCVVARVSVTQ